MRERGAEEGDEGGLRAADEGKRSEGLRAHCGLQDREGGVDDGERLADAHIQAEENLCPEGVRLFFNV